VRRKAFALACAAAFVSRLPAAEPEAERAAAFPDLPAMHVHRGGDPLRGLLLADRLEWQGDARDGQAAWDVIGWAGHDASRLWLRAEGEREHGTTQASTLEAFWGRPVARWWDLLIGVRHDLDPGAARTWGAVGLVGMAPYEFDVRLTAYVGEGGATSLRAEVEYDLLLSQRLVLQPRVEARLFGGRDTPRAQSSGLSETSLGLRLRYELAREFAPYAGLEWARRDGGRDDRLTAVLGIRAWL
jgi:copper resistance protein B